MSSDSIRSEIADILMSDRVMRTSAMGRDYALVEADAILSSGVVRHIQAEALRNAAIKAQEAFIAEQDGVGYARVRTDWLHAEAERIENGD